MIKLKYPFLVWAGQVQDERRQATSYQLSLERERCYFTLGSPWPSLGFVYQVKKAIKFKFTLQRFYLNIMWKEKIHILQKSCFICLYAIWNIPFVLARSSSKWRTEPTRIVSKLSDNVKHHKELPLYGGCKPHSQHANYYLIQLPEGLL